MNIYLLIFVLIPLAATVCAAVIVAKEKGVRPGQPRSGFR
jgi:hypothetical protein